jgi:hypothetical protein
VPPRNPALDTAERAIPKKRKARYVVEIRNAMGASLFLTTADWTDSERDEAMADILRLLGHRPADPKRQAREAHSGEPRSAKPNKN